MRWLIAFFWVLFASMGISVADDSETLVPGIFEGEILLEPIDDPFIPQFRLVHELRFRQSDGRIWVTPAGTVIDGRSVPKLFPGLFGPPMEGTYRKSMVTYDYAVKSKHHPWQAAQHMFYEGVLIEGVSTEDAKVMYMLLRATGSRWAVQGPSNCFSRCHGPGAKLEWRPRVDDSQVLELVDWVRAGDPSLEEIDKGVRSAVLEEGPHSAVPIR